MGNPYRSQFTDDNNQLRVDGSVTFTDAANQPGGSSTVLSREVTLTAAQLLASFATPAEIVPAAGASQAIIPIQVLFRYNHVTTNYTFVGDDFLYVSTAMELASGNGGFYGQTTQPALLEVFNTSAMCLMTPKDDVWPANAKGQALVVTPGSAMSLGDGTLTVTTFYTLVTLP